MSATMSIIDEYVEQDKRLQDPEVKREIVANNLGLNFERLIKIGKGTREIHYTKIYGEEIPLRVISRDEETHLQHSCVVEMAEKFPHFKGLLFNINFEKMFQKKLISLATSVCIEATSKRYLSEDEVGSLTSYTLAALVTEYERLEKEYNPTINQIDEEEVNRLLVRLLDPEKKSIIMTGLTSNQTSNALNKLLDVVIELEGNTSIIDSLIDTSSVNQN
jgi:hypothetical protein